MGGQLLDARAVEIQRRLGGPVESIADNLRAANIDALAYHAGLDASIRAERQQRFQAQDDVVMAATIATYAAEKEALEEFIVERIAAGAPLATTYPPDAATMARYETWRAAKLTGGQPRPG